MCNIGPLKALIDDLTAAGVQPQAGTPPGEIRVHVAVILFEGEVDGTIVAATPEKLEHAINGYFDALAAEEGVVDDEDFRSDFRIERMNPPLYTGE